MKIKEAVLILLLDEKSKPQVHTPPPWLELEIDSALGHIGPGESLEVGGQDPAGATRCWPPLINAKVCGTATRSRVATREGGTTRGQNGGLCYYIQSASACLVWSVSTGALEEVSQRDRKWSESWYS